MKILCIFLIFILNADFSLSSEPTAYNYTGYSAKYMNKSINSTNPMIQQSESDSSALLYVNHRKNNDYYSSMDYTVKETTIQKEGISTNLENSLSYCINSAVLNSGLKISLRKVSVYTKSEGAIGICVTNEGDVRVSESSVSTQSKNSIAIHASGGGDIEGYDSFIYTSGENSPALSAQKGSYIYCKNCQLHTTNKGSPLIQTFAGTEFINSYGLAENSQAIIADGGMYITIKNSTLNCSWKANGDDIPDASGILLKNTSFNADEDKTLSTSLEVEKSTLEINSETAPMILVDNAYINFEIKNSKIKSKIFLKLKNASENTNIYFYKCDIEGDIIADEKANLYIRLEKSKFVGAINPDGKAGYVNFDMDKKSNVTLTGNSKCDKFYSEDETNSNVNKNSFSLAGLEEDSSSNLLISKIMLLLLAYLLI